MNRRDFLGLCGGAAAAPARRTAAARPNIIVILADDIGYGDFSCYGATRVTTPNVDRLASGGLRFTDAHSSAATCTPSRYSLLTGEYAFRRKGTNILPGDAPLSVDPRRGTVASLLKAAGYATGCVGKWHLGLGNGNIDWNGEIRPGPLEVGFDYSFIIPATGDRVPCVFVENHRVAGLDPRDPLQVSYQHKVGNEPTGAERPDLLRMKLSAGHDQTIINGISRIGYMSGGKSARWVDEQISKTLTARAVSFIERRGGRPFFLYFATHDIHVPRVPNADFCGKTLCGVRCDAIAEFDWSVGQILATLERHKLAENTLILVTSDNGPVVDDGYADGSVEALDGHQPAGPLRGGKYSIYEGGTRVPLIAAWGRRIKPGTSEALVCQVDLLASFATLADRRLRADAGPDSFDVLPALLGKSPRGRDHLVEQANGTALRKGNWKLIPAGMRRGAARQPGDYAPKTEPELYNLADDIGETRDLAAREPQRVREMIAMLQELRAAGRSRA